ncbi:MAG: type II toxin-antitoxin system VapB family antitoxin [Nitrosotalea sp.]
MSSSSLSVRISKEIKEQMKKIEIDWSQYIRDAIRQRIRKEKRREAAHSMDEVRAKTKYGDFDAVASIRDDRDT